MTTTPESQSSAPAQETGAPANATRTAGPAHPRAGISSAVGSRLAAMLLKASEAEPVPLSRAA